MTTYLTTGIRPATIVYVTATGKRITLSAGALINRRALGV